MIISISNFRMHLSRNWRKAGFPPLAFLLKRRNAGFEYAAQQENRLLRKVGKIDHTGRTSTRWQVRPRADKTSTR